MMASVRTPHPARIRGTDLGRVPMPREVRGVRVVPPSRPITPGSREAHLIREVRPSLSATPRWFGPR
jgi:hypothetical protein